MDKPIIDLEELLEEAQDRIEEKIAIECWLLAENFTGREFSSYPFFVPLRNFNTF